MLNEAFALLADPTRRLLIEALRSGEHAVNDLVEEVAIHQSGVSRHLRLLTEAGFVQVRPDGAQRFYSLRPEPFAEVDRWLGPYRQLWVDRLDRLEAALATRRTQRRSRSSPRK